MNRWGALIVIAVLLCVSVWMGDYFIQHNMLLRYCEIINQFHSYSLCISVNVKFYWKVECSKFHSVIAFITPIIHRIKHFSSVTVVRHILDFTICTTLIKLWEKSVWSKVWRKPPMNTCLNSQDLNSVDSSSTVGEIVNDIVWWTLWCFEFVSKMRSSTYITHTLNFSTRSHQHVWIIYQHHRLSKVTRTCAWRTGVSVIGEHEFLWSGDTETGFL